MLIVVIGLLIFLYSIVIALYFIIILRRIVEFLTFGKYTISQCQGFSMGKENYFGVYLSMFKPSQHDLNVGDCITYYSPRENIIVSHRIIRIKKTKNGKITQIHCKGDNNPWQDEPIPFKLVISKHISKLRFLAILSVLEARVMYLEFRRHIDNPVWIPNYHDFESMYRFNVKQCVYKGK